RGHFGQTLTPPGTGTGANIMAAAAAQVSPVNGLPDEETSSSLNVAEPNQTAELRRTGGKEQAASQRIIPPLGFTLALSPFTPYRTVVRRSVRAQPMLAANRRDEALMAWLISQADTKGMVEDFNDD